MLRQFCLAIVLHNSERKNYCFSGALCETVSPSVVIGSKDFKPEGILIVIKADTCLYKKCSLSSCSCISPLISAELKHKKILQRSQDLQPATLLSTLLFILQLKLDIT